MSETARASRLILQFQANRNLKLLSDAGVPIAMGTDSGASIGRWQGCFDHVEMEMMVKAVPWRDPRCASWALEPCSWSAP